MKIRIDIDKSVALMAGEDRHGYFVVDVPAADLTERQREVVARYDYSGNDRQAPDADFYLDRAAGRGNNSGDPFWAECRALTRVVVRPDVESVVRLIDAIGVVDDAEAARKLAREEAGRAALEEKVEEFLRADPNDYLVRSHVESFDDKVDGTLVRTFKWAINTYGVPADPRVVAARPRLEAAREARDRETYLVEHTPRLLEARAEAEAKAGREREKAAWIDSHGSEHLRRAFKRGHDCLRLYATERAALEHPGFFVDFDDDLKWKSRACPSTGALDLADAVEGSEIVWLTRWFGEDEDDFDGAEGLLVRGFLGKYDLARLVGSED